MDLTTSNIAEMEQVVIISAGGFGRTVAHLASTDPDHGRRWYVAGFLEDRSEMAAKTSLPIYGAPLSYRRQAQQSFICALGDPQQRRRYAAPLLAQNAPFLNLCTGLGWSEGNEMGQGCLFERDVKLGVDTRFGDFVFVLSTSIIGYEVRIGSYSTIGSFVFIGGRAQIGSDVQIHPHATILPGVKIGDGAVIGAGSVVVANVPPGVTVIGNPAKKFRFK